MPGTLLVTGASRGIGAAIAVLAARRLGYALAVNYRERRNEAEQIVAEIEKGGP